jgi:RNA polymerase sigma-70 factor (ECF subfamily)
MILSTALEKLPEDKREVLLLSKFHEKKYKDIGEILGCSEGAVKVKVFRALQDLKDLYQQLDRRM